MERRPNIIRSHFTGVQEVAGVAVPVCTNAHADIVAQCTARRLLKAESNGKNSRNVSRTAGRAIEICSSQPDGRANTSSSPVLLTTLSSTTTTTSTITGPSIPIDKVQDSARVNRSNSYTTTSTSTSSPLEVVTVAATQFACSSSREDCEDRAEALVREAAGLGAQLVLLQELFQCLSLPSQVLC